MGRARFFSRAGRTSSFHRGQFRWFGFKEGQRDTKKATKTSLECERKNPFLRPRLTHSDRHGGFFWTTNRMVEHFSTPLSIAINYQSTDGLTRILHTQLGKGKTKYKANPSSVNVKDWVRSVSKRSFLYQLPNIAPGHCQKRRDKKVTMKSTREWYCHCPE